MCRRAGLLVGWDYAAHRALVTWARCDSWNCPDCARRMRERWTLRAAMGARAILQRGETLDFATITSHEALKGFEQTEYVWRKAWPSLYSALKRRNQRLEYIIIPERHKDGRMHVHALWNAGVKKGWLKDNARTRGLGFQCEVIHCTVERHAAKYVSKYVGKDIGDISSPHFRRIRCSRDWPDIDSPNNELAALKWEHVGTNGALHGVYLECQAKHISLIDLETGALFEDVDLGTIVAGQLDVYAQISI